MKQKIFLCISIISAFILLCCIFSTNSSNASLECTIVNCRTNSFSVMISKRETEFLKQQPSLETKLLTVIVNNKKDLATFRKGDTVKIIFDGSIQESSPPSIDAEKIILISHN